MNGGRIPVLSRMIAGDLLRTLAAVWSVLAVVIVSNSFVRVLDKAIEGRVASDTLLALLGLKALGVATALLPAALFMAALMVLGRMHRDHEMQAVASAGGGLGRIYRALSWVVAPVAVLAAGLSLYAAPWAEATVMALMQEDADSADVRGIAAGKFSEYSHGDLVFYVEEIGDDNTLRKVFVHSRLHGRLATINAESARMRLLPEGRYLVFSDGERVQGTPGQADFQIERFGEYGVRMADVASEVVYSRAAMPSSALLQSAALPDIAELQRRWSLPLTVVLFALLAAPLAQTAPRGGVYGNVLIGFLIYFSHGNLAKVCQLWVGQGVLAPWLGALAMNGFLLLVGALLLARNQSWCGLRALVRARLKP